MDHQIQPTQYAEGASSPVLSYEETFLREEIATITPELTARVEAALETAHSITAFIEAAARWCETEIEDPKGAALFREFSARFAGHETELI